MHCDEDLAINNAINNCYGIFNSLAWAFFFLCSDNRCLALLECYQYMQYDCIKCNRMSDCEMKL